MCGTFEEPPTGLIPWFSKLREILKLHLLHHPLLFEETNASSRRSKKDFWHRCRGGFHQVKSRFDIPPTCDFWRRYQGGLRSSQDIPSTHHKLISLAFTLFSICLSFSSPPLHPCRFIRPLFPNLLLSFPFAFSRCLSVWSCVSLLICRDGST